MSKPKILVTGMGGLGDNIHIRAIVRKIMPDYEVWLETPWPSVFWDLIGVHLLEKATPLRTQTKNATRERALFETIRPDNFDRHIKIWYRPDEVRECGSVLGAMMKNAGVAGSADFSLPVNADWLAKADAWIDRWKPSKPLLFYRPLIERKEWSGCPARNPDHVAYGKLLEHIRDNFFLVSIADLVPGIEWMVYGTPADATCHAGELDFRTLAGLMVRSSLAWTSPGFATVLALSVGTPVVTVFGGYENSKSFAGAGYLGIDPIKSCQCFSHHHSCQKEIDIPAAQQRIQEFTNASIDQIAA